MIIIHTIRHQALSSFNVTVLVGNVILVLGFRDNVLIVVVLWLLLLLLLLLLCRCFCFNFLGHCYYYRYGDQCFRKMFMFSQML